MAFQQFKAFVGMIIPYANNNVPAGFLQCDGLDVGKTDPGGGSGYYGEAYRKLFDFLKYGWGNNSGYSFDNPGEYVNLPALKGTMLRGKDDMGSAAGAAGRDSVRSIGDNQAQALASHATSHDVKLKGATLLGWFSWAPLRLRTWYSSEAVNSTGMTEGRFAANSAVRNIYMNYIIKI